MSRRSPRPCPSPRARVALVALLTLLHVAGDGLAAPAAATTAAQGARLAVLPIIGDGVLVDDLAPIEDALRREVTQLRQYRVQDRERTLAELRSARSLGLHCAPFEVGCLVRLGLVSEMDLVVVPEATREGRFVAVTLSLVDVAREREVARVARVMDPRTIEESAARLVAELLSAPPDVGMLAISATPDDAAVLVDGQERGRTPLRAPIGGLREGEHRLVVQKQGYRPAHATVVVKARTISRYDLRLAALDDEEAGESSARRVEEPAVTRAAAQGRAALTERDALTGTSLDNGRLVGAAATGAVAAALALGGGLGAFTLFGLESGDTLPAAQRESARLGAQALLVVAAGGALVAIGSAAFLGVELVQQGDEVDPPE